VAHLQDAARPNIALALPHLGHPTERHGTIRVQTIDGTGLIGAHATTHPDKQTRLAHVAWPRAFFNAEHAGTIKVSHTLRPFAVAMAGAGEFDPFKD
jgi:hypothetical protein